MARKSINVKHPEIRSIRRVWAEILSFRKAIALSVLLAVGFPAPAAGQMGLAYALLDKYAAGQAAFTKMKVQYEISSESDQKLSGPYNKGNGFRREYGEGMVLFDGTRFSHRFYFWGEIDGPGRYRSREEAGYNSCLFDGKRIIHYSHRLGDIVTPNGSGSVVTRKKSKQIDRTPDDDFIGYLFDNDERIDKILKQAGYIQVMRETDTNGTPGCFILSARISYGTYAIWLDPEHGYNIVRAVCRHQPGDRLRSTSQPLTAGMVVDNSTTITRFEKRGKLWIPMEYAWTRSRTNNADYENARGIVKRTEVIISPDFAALGAFVPDDIHDGALFSKDGQVYVSDRSGPRFVWRKGNAVPETE